MNLGVGLGVVPFWAEDVLQVQAAVSLNVEAFVFDLGAKPSDLVGDGDERIPVDRQTGQPGKGCFLAGGGGFLAEQGAQGPGAFLAVGIGQMLDPAVYAASLARQRHGELLFWREFQEGLELAPQAQCGPL